MKTRILKTEADYEAALAEIEELFDRPDDDVDARDRAELLALLIDKFESERYPIPSGSPIDVVRFVMDQHDLEQKDLADVFGAATRVSDFLRGVRGLSLPTIVALHRKFHIPYAALIDEEAERKPRGKKTKSAVKLKEKRRRSEGKDGSSVAGESTPAYRRSTRHKK